MMSKTVKKGEEEKEKKEEEKEEEEEVGALYYRIFKMISKCIEDLLNCEVRR